MWKNIFRFYWDLKNWRGYCIGVVLVALATWLKYLAQPDIIPANVPILYTAVIIITAIFYGLAPTLLVCFVSLFAFDYFFVPPIYTISLSGLTNAPIEGIFILSGVILSMLTSHFRYINEEANNRAAEISKNEKELKLRRDQLEDEIKQRTSELEKTNKLLSTEINERKKIEEVLEEEIDLRSRFIDILAHELRGPLSPILNSSENLNELLKNNPDESLKRLAANVYSSAEVLSSHLEELLESARYSRGAFTINLQSTDVIKFMQEIELRYKPSIEQTGHKLTFNYPEQPLFVVLDRSKIEQVIVNLLSNASKYSYPDSLIELFIRSENGQLIIEVKDQGEGLAEIDKNNLFSPYFRLSHYHKNIKGLGLGLSICKQIVEAHGGTIEVKSQIGIGSIFTFCLPPREIQASQLPSKTG